MNPFALWYPEIFGARIRAARTLLAGRERSRLKRGAPSRGRNAPVALRTSRRYGPARLTPRYIDAMPALVRNAGLSQSSGSGCLDRTRAGHVSAPASDRGPGHRRGLFQLRVAPFPPALQ
jgi:hypothetical protein